ncbi:MAG TPA: 3-isopropylmalate dehydrogenase [Firmicutes bacterium]|nr:3-isopropylmalate dehydrogenase [Bacillota bacterium]
MAEAVKVLRRAGDIFGYTLEFEEAAVGGAAIDLYGDPLPERTLQVALEADAVLFGAVGGPKWDNQPPERRPEQGILRLRKRLGLYVNMRPATLYPELIESSPLKKAAVDGGFDMLIVRELSSGLYYGEPKERRTIGGVRQAIDTLFYSEKEIERCVRSAFDAAMSRRRKVTSVDKANVLMASRLWREVVEEVARDYPEVQVEHQYVDACAMLLVREPKRFDVLVTENTFGDILSDLAGAITGSLGMLPSASLGAGGRGLYEPIHGSAPDIAGKGIANPVGAILSGAMMLEYAFGLRHPAQAIRRAVRRVLGSGYVTPDLVRGHTGTQTVVNTRQMGDLVVEQILKEDERL